MCEVAQGDGGGDECDVIHHRAVTCTESRGADAERRLSSISGERK